MENLDKLWQNYLHRKLSREETVQFLEALQKSENGPQLESLLKKEWDAAENQEGQKLANKKLLIKIRRAMGIGNSLSRNLYKYAAAVLIAVTMGTGVWWAATGTGAKNDFVRLAVPAGGPPAAFTLPDGSTVWLNAATVVEYRKDFVAHRNVKMEGEAYFEVAPNKKSRFSITFKNNELVVTGTKFNIKSYKNEGMSYVDIKEGHVTVYHSTDSTDLLKDHHLAINDQNGAATFSQTDFTGSNAWKNGGLNFRNAPMDEVFRAMERYYNIHIDLVQLSPDIKNKRITVTFPKEATLTEVLEGLRLVQHFGYRFPQKNVVEIKLE